MSTILLTDNDATVYLDVYLPEHYVVEMNGDHPVVKMLVAMGGEVATELATSAVRRALDETNGDLDAINEGGTWMRVHRAAS